MRMWFGVFLCPPSSPFIFILCIYKLSAKV